jgi:hypothetical protein
MERKTIPEYDTRRNKKDKEGDQRKDGLKTRNRI